MADLVPARTDSRYAPRQPTDRRRQPDGRIGRSVLLFLCLLIPTLAVVPAAGALDPFPVLLKEGGTFDVPADAQPGWLYTNAGSHTPSDVRLLDADGALVRTIPADRSHQATFVDVDGDPDADDDGSGSDSTLRVQTVDRTWVAWARDWRFRAEDGASLHVGCPVDETMAFLWSPPVPRGVLSVVGNESGLDLFVYADAPLRLLFHDDGAVDWQSGVMGAGDRAFWVVARSTGEPCGEGYDLMFVEDTVIDLNAFDSLGWLIAAGVFVMIVLLWFSRPGQGNKLGPGKGARAFVPVGIVLSLLLAGSAGLLLTPGAEANGGGDAHAFDTGPLVAGGFQGVPVAEGGGRLCFQASDAEAAGRVQVIEDARGQDELRTLQVPAAPARVCTMVEGGPVEFAGEAAGRYLLMPEEPRTMRTPGTRIVDGGGGAFILQDATRDTRLGALVQSGWSVHVVDLATFRLVASTTQAGEIPDLVDGLEDKAAGQRTDLLVVAVNHRADQAGDVRIEWQDTSWFALAPTLGHVLMVATLALFLVLFKEGGRGHPMYGPPRR